MDKVQSNCVKLVLDRKKTKKSERRVLESKTALEADSSAELSVDDLIQRTELSARVDHLMTSTLRAISRRERLPQPLFWSLFHTEVAGIKKRRKKKREELAKQFGCDWL